MKIKRRASRRATLAIGAAASFAAHAASARGEAIEEIVVYATPTVLVLDTASMRIDVKQSVRALGRSVSEALGEKVPETRVAIAEPRRRG
jgi:hypothetical protein